MHLPQVSVSLANQQNHLPLNNKTQINSNRPLRVEQFFHFKILQINNRLQGFLVRKMKRIRLLLLDYSPIIRQKLNLKINLLYSDNSPNQLPQHPRRYSLHPHQAHYSELQLNKNLPSNNQILFLVHHKIKTSHLSLRLLKAVCLELLDNQPQILLLFLEALKHKIKLQVQPLSLVELNNNSNNLNQIAYLQHLLLLNSNSNLKV